MISLNLQGAEATKFIISVHDYENKNALDFYDKNWLRCELFAEAEKFSAHVICSLASEEIFYIKNSIKELLNSNKDAHFESLEKNLKFFIFRKPNGIFLVNLIVWELKKIDKKITIEFETEELFVQDFLKNLEQATDVFPIIS